MSGVVWYRNYLVVIRSFHGVFLVRVSKTPQSLVHNVTKFPQWVAIGQKGGFQMVNLGLEVVR